MNRFIAGLVGKMRDVDIYTVLVKGQGVVQCYERPLWRSCGDVDLLLSPENYPKAKLFLLDLCTTNKLEERYSKHLGLILDSWYVEIHGLLRTGLSSRVDKVIDEVQRDVIYNGNVRSWDNGSIQVFLPSHDNDIYFIFTHFLMHFYRERMNLRQLSDLCRLLWTFRERIDSKVLKLRLKQAGLLPEWKAFTALSAKYLGMPTEAIPLYDKNEKKWLNKAESIINYILLGYSSNWAINTWRIAKIFPLKVFQYLPSICLNVNWLKIKERVLGL